MNTNLIFQRLEKVMTREEKAIAKRFAVQRTQWIHKYSVKIYAFLDVLVFF